MCLVETHPNKDRPEAKSRVQSVQRAVEGNGNMEYFEICEIIGRNALYTVLAEYAHDLPIKFEN